ncbi:hypothetical protein ZWY2020_021880 [Hordeum vulgare]|nr:hypothetical protein ZWY2020_021880 [Hordeum vulgare]
MAFSCSSEASSSGHARRWHVSLDGSSSACSYSEVAASPRSPVPTARRSATPPVDPPACRSDAPAISTLTYLVSITLARAELDTPTPCSPAPGVDPDDGQGGDQGRRDDDPARHARQCFRGRKRRRTGSTPASRADGMQMDELPGRATRARSALTASPLLLVGPRSVKCDVRSRSRRRSARSASSGHGLAYAGPVAPVAHVSPKSAAKQACSPIPVPAESEA